ncbi:MAG: DUF6252 family protein [Xanthomonadales bacterium]|nr:DUF6252 family protein [Xanthomonadales bacterium]
MSNTPRSAVMRADAEGPWKIGSHVADARVFGTSGGASVTLELRRPLAPGEYVISDNTDEEASPVGGVVYADSDEQRIDFSRARFGIVDAHPGKIVIERLDQESATGTFEFVAHNRAEPPETVNVSGSFTDLAYTPDVELDVSGTGPFAAMPEGFNEAEARITDRQLELTLASRWASDVAITVPANEAGTVAPGPKQPGSVTTTAESGSGEITLTRTGETLGGHFEVEVRHDGASGTLSGEFDYVPVDGYSQP